MNYHTFTPSIHLLGEFTLYIIIFNNREGLISVNDVVKVTK